MNVFKLATFKSELLSKHVQVKNKVSTSLQNSIYNPRIGKPV